MVVKKDPNKFKEFNKFQSAFYLSIQKFKEFTKFEVKRNGYGLLNSMAKGYPTLSDMFLNCYGLNWKAVESPAVLQALQRNFINGFNTPNIPQYVFFKPSPTKKPQKEKAIKTKDGLIFSSDIVSEICSKLLIDSKTYEYNKFTEQIQFLGKQLSGQFTTTKKIRKTKKKIKL